MEQVHATLRLVPEFRQYRMATKGGDDVLSLYDTLYRAYVSLHMLRRSGVASVPLPELGDTCGQATASICPSSLADDTAMMVDHSDILLPSDSLAGPSNVASLDNVAILEAKHARKLELRHENRRNKRKNAPPPKRPEKPGFGFRCTLCVQVPSYFNRNGLLRHLKSTHKSKANRLNELDRATIHRLLQPFKVTDNDFKSEVASYLDL